MQILSDKSSPADGWPPWTDSETWELGPAPEDFRWWASQNDSWDADEPVPDEVLDRWAEESAAQNALECGFRHY